jgi:predicted nucleic acid-binding protein
VILVDTNIPLRIAQVEHPHRRVALEALQSLTLRDGEHFAIAPQSLYEMYVVCSRPASVNGLGMTPQQAHAEITAARALFQLLPETSQVYPTWEGLVAKYAVQGKQAHDARLVALMIEHRVPRILTFNDTDFRPYTEIAALNPFDVLGVPRI